MGPCNQNFGEINIFRTFITVKHFCFLLFDLISIVDWCKTRILYQFFPKSSVWDSKIHHNLYHHMLVFLDLHCLEDLIYYNILYQTLPFISLLTELFLLAAESSLLNHFLFFYLLFFQILKSLRQMKTHDFIVNPDPFPLFSIFLAKLERIFWWNLLYPSQYSFPSFTTKWNTFRHGSESKE